MPRIRLSELNGVFKFQDPSGSPIPSIKRGQSFDLEIEPSVDADEVELSNFQALIGPPWVPDPHYNDLKPIPGFEFRLGTNGWEETTNSSKLPLKASLQTSCPQHWPHRLIVFDVTIKHGGKVVAAYTDPWDESPDYP